LCRLAEIFLNHLLELSGEDLACFALLLIPVVVLLRRLLHNQLHSGAERFLSQGVGISLIFNLVVGRS
jgi:hypothetical protein